MAKNIDFMGAVFPDVPSVKLPQQGGGLVSFDDTTDATATADKILQGYTAYANGQKLVGTASGGITPSGTIQITQNGQVDVTQYATADVNVSGGGGGIGTLLLTQTLGAVSTTSTSAINLGITLTVPNINSYDLLLVESSRSATAYNRHMSTVSLVVLLNSTSPGCEEAKATSLISTGIQFKMGSGLSAFLQSRASNAAYGIYPSSCTISNGSVTLSMGARYNSTNTGTIDGDYTTRVYGINLCELFIG